MRDVGLCVMQLSADSPLKRSLMPGEVRAGRGDPLQGRSEQVEVTPSRRGSEQVEVTPSRRGSEQDPLQYSKVPLGVQSTPF